MKNVLVVARREFRSAFDLPIAYVFIAAFLILAALGGLLGFFDRGVADLRDYFAAIRYAFVLFAPAVSMRLWAEERRSGTFELLFTLPVKPWETVVGKFLGALGLVAVALLLGTSLPLSLAYWAHFDVGAVLAGYLGVLLLAAVEIALGLLVSSLTDNQIVAFVGAAVASFLLLIVGEPGVLAEAEHFQVPDWLVPIRSALVGGLSRLGTGEHQDALSRGVLDTRDLVYFFAFTAFFLTANVVAVERRRRSRLEGALVILLAGAAFFLAEDAASRRRVRFDLTSRNAFSLHPSTKAALKNLDARLTLRCYLSRDLSAREERQRRNLLDLLHEIEAVGGKNVRLEVFDPKGDEKLTEQANREGIQHLTRQMLSSEAAETKVIWGGVSLLYGGKPPLSIPLALYKPNLEYEIAVLIHKLAQKEAQRIAWIEPAAQGQRGTAYQVVRSELARTYTVEGCDLKSVNEIKKDYQTAVLVLDQGVAPLDDRSLYELDQFLMRGGSLVVLVKVTNVDARSMHATPIDWGRTTQALKRWGVEVPQRLVMARSVHMHSFPLPARQARGQRIWAQYPYFLEPDGNSNQGSPIAEQLTHAFLPFAGEVLAPERKGSRIDLLLKTTRDALALEGPLDVDPVAAVEQLRANHNRETKTVAAAVSGEIPSFFDAPVPPSRPTPTDPLATRIATATSGRLVVFAESDFAKDATREGFQEAFGQNVTLLLNAIDWAAQDPSLATMRTREGAPPLNDISESARALAWLWNLIIMPVAVGLLGVLRFWLRRRAGRRAATLSRKAVGAA